MYHDLFTSHTLFKLHLIPEVAMPMDKSKRCKSLCGMYKCDFEVAMYNCVFEVADLLSLMLSPANWGRGVDPGPMA